MIIKNIKTGVNHPVSRAIWEKIKENGDEYHYEVVAEEAPETPKEVKNLSTPETGKK